MAFEIARNSEYCIVQDFQHFTIIFCVCLTFFSVFIHIFDQIMILSVFGCFGQKNIENLTEFGAYRFFFLFFLNLETGRVSEKNFEPPDLTTLFFFNPLNGVYSSPDFTFLRSFHRHLECWDD